MTTLDASIRQAVEAYLARSQLSERKLGAFAVGNPGLIPQIKAGGSMWLDTADQLLSYMNEEPVGPTFRSEVEAFLSETGVGERKFGAKAAGDPAFVMKLRSEVSPRLSTVQRVQGWMRARKDELIRAAAARKVAEHRECANDPSSDGEAKDTLDASAPRPHSDDESVLERTSPAEDNSKMFLTRREAAALLMLSPRTLDRYHVYGSGARSKSCAPGGDIRQSADLRRLHCGSRTPGVMPDRRPRSRSFVILLPTRRARRAHSARGCPSGSKAGHRP